MKVYLLWQASYQDEDELLGVWSTYERALQEGACRNGNVMCDRDWRGDYIQEVVVDSYYLCS